MGYFYAQYDSLGLEVGENLGVITNKLRVGLDDVDDGKFLRNPLIPQDPITYGNLDEGGWGIL